ncbi:hypothetical protein AB0M05_44075 [Streptomyces violaceusniger]|uniref:hypothetical protein n=1 Tax=Streptomyces violaceusniger TaxID=68280 RepID=UPI003445AD88
MKYKSFLDALSVPEEGNENSRKSISRRRILGASGAALCAAGCTNGPTDRDRSAEEDRSSKEEKLAQGPEGVLGANFNSEPGSVSFNELRNLSAGWVRGFLPMKGLRGADADPAELPMVKKLLTAHRGGYGTVLSLKFPYNHRALPKPASPAMTAELARLDKVLHTVLNNIDILTIGNEPFIESLPGDRVSGALNAFYEKVTAHIIAYRKKSFRSGCRTRLYMGALNNIERPAERTKATDRWLYFTRATPEIEGVDIHPHVRSQADIQPYLDYVLPLLRKEQKFLVTEFSLVHLWKQHMKDTVPARFARRYRIPQGTPVWKIIAEAIEHPMPEERWRDFLSISPWFENNKHFLRDQMGRFRDTGRLAVATYGVAQGASMVRDFSPRKQPWLLNSLYGNRTVERTDDGLPVGTYGFFDDFRALQRSEDRRPVRLKRVAT